MNKGIKTPDYIVQLARDMRNNLTPGERLLWERLKSRQLAGYKFRYQHPIYHYILDFYCDEKLLAIEVDGNVHKERKDYDEYRDDFMKSLGIQTMRFDNDEIMNNIDTVLDMIKKELLEKA
ncbi:MAG: endonuclease domain-containing protein [Spirochaetes bacterium]|nr:endonuclease domain-containing protein [Spirochaetota bacterium]